MLKKLKERLAKAAKRLSVTTQALVKNRKYRDEAITRLHDLHDKWDELVEDRKRLQIELDHTDPSDPAYSKIKAKLDALHDEQVRVQEKAKDKDTERDRLIARVDTLFQRQKWLVKRKTTLRRKIKKAKEEAQNGQPEYEPWMANGHDDNVTPGVKLFIARGVVLYDLVCTSLRRTYVPPGGSSTSFHLYTPGEAGDIAGPRMSDFQASEFERNKGNANCLELFGPINTQWLKYGAVTGGAEGTPLENLHDSHVHGAFN